MGISNSRDRCGWINQGPNKPGIVVLESPRYTRKRPMTPSFVHLHCHSEYSLLDGAIRVDQLIDSASEMGMSALALTDNGVMFGAIEFYLAAKAKGIKPIFGCEVYVTPTIAEKSRGLDRLILLAMDQVGYRNLTQVVTISHLEGFYYKPRIDLAHLAQYADGIIAISPGYGGPVAYRVRSNRVSEATTIAQEFKAIYGDRFYLGVSRHDLPMEELIIEETKRISAELGIGLVATNDVYYLRREDSFLRTILHCIQTGRKLDEDTGFDHEQNEAFFRSPAEMVERFSDIPESISNTVKIADLCQLSLVTEQVILPNFECPNDLTPHAYLSELVWKGMTGRYPELTDELRDRTNFELSIIEKMGYPIYFLIIYDFLEYCRQSGIPIGPGRGSAAGSIVSYALGITHVDPIRYNLLFERFLNPDRVSMPDIDLDFCIRRRSEVIEYIVQKYGKANVSQIATFGTMAARGVIRDVGRVLNVPLTDVDRIAKLIPAVPGQPTSIAEALERIPDLRKAQADSPAITRLLEIAQRLEGFSRHSSTHAAGVVISRDPLTYVVPLMQNDGQAVTQFSMTDLEKIGLLKMDILGLRNLTVIDDSVKMIAQNHGVTLDLNTLPTDDSATYDLLCKGETVGIFQLESRGMRALIKDLQPRVFEDIIALLALYRPGPLGSGMVKDFISNKSGKTQVQYELPQLEPILKDTYGMIVYQEQVMQIASAIAGFTLGEADELRRAMGKKKKDVMDGMRVKFIDGAKANKNPTDKSERIFDLCYKFAEYGFNKSHSAAYALISYQTAYLKTHYPKEYLCALLSSVLGSNDKTALYIAECRKMGISVLAPDVRKSGVSFLVTDEGIRFGMGAIKNVGEGAIESICGAREGKGDFPTLMDFCLKVDLKQVNKRVIESLIKTGCFDYISKERAMLLAQLERTMDQAQTHLKEKSNGQVSLFGDASSGSPSLMPIQPDELTYTPLVFLDMLKLEKELLGLYISGHPLDKYTAILDKAPSTLADITEDDEDRPVSFVGLLSNCRKHTTRSNRELLIGTLEDLTGSIPIMAFQGRNFDQLAQAWVDDTVVQVTGKIRVNQDEVSISVEQVKALDSAGFERQLHIDLDGLDSNDKLNSLRVILSTTPGEMPIYLHVDDSTILAHRKYWLKEDALSIAQIEDLMGKTKVWTT